MWIFFNNAFLSVVVPKDKKGVLQVRARIKGDIERVFPDAKVIETPGRDYRYRAFIARDVVASVMAQQVMDISATNFKDSVTEGWRHDAYMSVWCVMNREQIAQHRRQDMAQEPDWFGDLPPHPAVSAGGKKRVTRGARQ